MSYPESYMKTPKSSYHILIICSGNICRSPMAEGILQDILPDALREWVLVDSAGIHAADGLNAEPFAVQACKKQGIDIAVHRARSVNLEMLARSDLILAMEQGHASFVRQLIPSEMDKVHLLGEFNNSQVAEEVPDPYGGSLEEYQKCAGQIRRHLKGVVKYLAQGKIRPRKEWI